MTDITCKTANMSDTMRIQGTFIAAAEPSRAKMVVKGGPGNGFSNVSVNRVKTGSHSTPILKQTNKKNQMVFMVHNVKSNSGKISMGKGGRIVKYILFSCDFFCNTITQIRVMTQLRVLKP